MRAPALAVDVIVEAGGWRTLRDPETLARSAVEAALEVADVLREGVEVAVLLTDDAAVRALNRAWREKDTPTNVLSFPAPALPTGAGPRHLGDIALAWETLAREAEDDGKAAEEHAGHLIVHGTLHLLGFDHLGQGQAETMEALEVKALRLLGIADPYEGRAPGD